MSIKPKPNRDLWILFSVISLDLVGFGIVVPILPFYAVQYGVSATLLGVLLTSFSAMQFLFTPVWGRLSDRWGRKNVLVVTMGGSTLALLLLGLANSLWVLFAARLLSGVFAANVSVASAYVTDITSEEDRSKGMGLIGAAFGVGFLLGPAIGGGLSSWGYSVPILAAAVLTALNMIYASLKLSEPPRHRAIEEKVSVSLLSSRKLFVFYLLSLIVTVAVNQLEAIFAFFMKDRFAFDAKEVAWLLVMMALVMMVIQGGAIRHLTGRFGEVRLLFFGAFLLAISMGGIPHFSKISWLVIPLLVAAVGRGVAYPSLMSLVSKIAPSGQRGVVMGTFHATGSLARVIGPLAAGFLYDRGQAFPFYFAGTLMLFFLLIQFKFLPTHTH